MTKITLNLTLEELKQIDKYVELNDETRPLFDKIKNAYPEPETLFDVIRNLGYSYDMCYEIVDAVEKFEKSKEPEKWDIKVKTDYLTGKARHKWNIVDKDGNDYKPTPQEPEDDEWTIEKLQEKNWYVDAKTLLKSKEPEVEDYLKPHTPEQIEKSLGEAFVKVQQTEKWKETQRKIDSKNPPKFLEFELGQNLTDLIYDWWEDVFTTNSNDDMENCIGRLVYWIEEWLPKEQSANSQNVDVEFLVEGFNDCLKKIKGKLR